MATSPGVHDAPRLAPVVGIDQGGHRERVLSRRDDLVNRHAYLVPKIARSVKRRAPASVTLDELIGVGNLALLHAATRYRPDAWGNAPFSAFARPAIRGAMINSFSGRLWRDANVISLELRKTKDADAGLQPGDVFTIESINIENPSTREEAAIAGIDASVLARRVGAALRLLPARQRLIMQECYSDREPTIAEVGRRMGIGPRRAQQLHREALNSLRGVLEAAV